MKKAFVAFVVLFAGIPGLCAGPIPGEVNCNQGLDMPRVQALVRKTVAALKKDQNKVIQEINRGDTKWKDGSLYVAVFQGTTVLAHGYFPSLAGQDVGSSRYLNSFPFVSSGRRIAMEKGEGCMQFKFHNPAKSGQIEDKIGFSTKVTDTIWVASGTYLTK
ncbi:MAG TPA: cache domain-containing protein [Candidatus Angelobacter sp.]|nr:cache domain-containing protein [Candidatus Angelobacter sp.]